MLEKISRERVWSELKIILSGPNAPKIIDTMRTHGVLDKILDGITHGEIMTHEMIGDKNECKNAFSYLKKTLDETVEEKPVFPRLTEVVLDRTFDIKNAQTILDEEGFNVGLFDSGFAYHINSIGVDKGSGLIKALEMLNADLEDTIALGDSETDVPMFKTVKNNIAVNNSIPELKEIAKIVTTKNSGEGLLEGLSMISDEFL